MIQANELRKGNTILFDDKIDNVKSIGERLCFGYKHSHWYFDRLHGVPLTPDILVKMGFEPSDDGIYIKDNICFRHYILSFAKVDFDNKGVRHFRTYISFVHQLQNLYFALTRKELPIDLTTLQ